LQSTIGYSQTMLQAELCISCVPTSLELGCKAYARGLRKTTKETGLDRKTIRAILNGKKVKASTLAKVVIGLRSE